MAQAVLALPTKLPTVAFRIFPTNYLSVHLLANMKSWHTRPKSGSPTPASNFGTGTRAIKLTGLRADLRMSGHLVLYQVESWW